MVSGSRGHRGGPRAPVTNVNSLLQKLYQADTSQETERPPDSTHAMPDTRHVLAQPRGRWLWGSGQVPALLGPESSPCGEWTSPGPPWAGGVLRPRRPGLHWTLTKLSPEVAAVPEPSARALWLSPALLRALETHHFLQEPCVDGGGRSCLGDHSSSANSPVPRGRPQPSQRLRPSLAPDCKPCSRRTQSSRARTPVPEGQGPSLPAGHALNTPGLAVTRKHTGVGTGAGQPPSPAHLHFPAVRFIKATCGCIGCGPPDLDSHLGARVGV